MKVIIDIPEYMYNDIKDFGITPLEWIPMRRNKYPQDGQHVFISTVTGKIHDLIWNSKCIHNYARNGCWYKNWFVKAWMPFFITPYKKESEDKE